MGGAPARPSPPGVGFECKAYRGQDDDYQQHDVYEVVDMNNDDTMTMMMILLIMLTVLTSHLLLLLKYGHSMVIVRSSY